MSAQDYFVVWGESAAVRDAYRTTLVEAVTYLDENHAEAAPLIFSSQLPGPAHDSSIARLVGSDRAAVGRNSRWTDVRSALVVPEDGEPLLVRPVSTPLHPAFRPLVYVIDSVQLRPGDLDPGFTLYEIDRGELRALLRSLTPVEPPGQLQRRDHADPCRLAER